MEERLVLSIFVCLSAAVGAALCVEWVIDAARLSRIRSLAQSDLDKDGSAVHRLLRNGIGPLMPCARWLCRKPRVARTLDVCMHAAQSKGRTATCESLCTLCIAAVFAFSVVMGCASRSALGALLGASLAVAGLVIWAQAWEERQGDALREAVPEALKAMEACSQTGLSLEQMLCQVADESPDELGRLFRGSANILETGGSASQALAYLKAGSNVSELAFVSVALDVQHQTGSSLKQVLEAAHDMVKGELELRRSLQVQTAQARLSARVVTIMPFALAALLTLVSKDFLAPFFESLEGLAVLLVALAMQLAGVLVVRRMLKVSE